MKILALALPLVFATAAWADDEPALPTKMSFNQDTERESHRPQEVGPAGPAGPVMDYIYFHSRLETGVLVTHFDNDLDVENAMGIYVRYSVEILPQIALNLTYRHYDFSNSDAPGTNSDMDIRGLIAGATFRLPLSQDFGFEAGGGVGFLNWDTSAPGFSDSNGMLVTGEAAFTVWLHEVLRLKAGVVMDTVYTDLHQSSTDSSVNLSYLVGIVLGGP